MPPSSTPDPASVETSHSIDDEGRDGTPLPEWDGTSVVTSAHMTGHLRWPAADATGQPVDIMIHRDGDHYILTAPSDVTVRDIVSALRLIQPGCRLADDLTVRFAE